MASQNYAKKYSGQIDERFKLESLTTSVINKGIKLDFHGVNGVTLHNVDTVAEVNYTRNGRDRFGSLVELGNGIQDLLMSQDKSFTFTIDRGNLEDTMMVQEAGSALDRELSEVCIPNTDIYRLGILQAYAVANSQTTSTAAITASNAYTKVLDAQIILDNNKVPRKGRVLFVSPTMYKFLKLDTNFIKASELAQNMLINGQLGEVDGCAIVMVPVTYLATSCAFILVHNTVLAAPQKFATYRTLDDVQGIDGWVVEGRRYYDAFVPTNRGKAIAAHMEA